MSDRDHFEAALTAAWKDRDFERWDSERLIYADWLEERGDPLAYMARAPCKFQKAGFGQRGGVTPKAYLWRLTFKVSHVLTSGWRTTLRVNRRMVLGIPPTCLRCTSEIGPVFTVIFKPRLSDAELERIPCNSTVSQRASMGIYFGFDEYIHCDGFPAMFYPPEVVVKELPLFERLAT